MTWHCTPHTYQPSAPASNDDEPLLVVPNQRGGFSLRFADSITLIGNFHSVKAAEDYAHSQCQHVRVLVPADNRQQHTPSAPILERKGLHLIHT